MTLNNDQWQEALVQLANTGLAVTNANANGQATMANSAPVVVASNQTPIATAMNGTGNANTELQSAAGFNLGPIDRNNFLAVATGGLVSLNNALVQKIPDTFKTATATASGDTAVWTPGAGNVFELLAYRVEVTANAATSGGAVITIVLRDGTTPTAFSHSVFLPSTAGTTMGSGYSSGWIWLGGYGFTSAAANNVLNVNLSAALSAGNVRVVAIGVEH